jgi:hypothetical protein
LFSPICRIQMSVHNEKATFKQQLQEYNHRGWTWIQSKSPRLYDFLCRYTSTILFLSLMVVPPIYFGNRLSTLPKYDNIIIECDTLKTEILKTETSHTNHSTNTSLFNSHIFKYFCGIYTKITETGPQWSFFDVLWNGFYVCILLTILYFLITMIAIISLGSWLGWILSWFISIPAELVMPLSTLIINTISVTWHLVQIYLGWLIIKWMSKDLYRQYCHSRNS